MKCTKMRPITCSRGLEHSQMENRHVFHSIARKCLVVNHGTPIDRENHHVHLERGVHLCRDLLLQRGHRAVHVHPHPDLKRRVVHHFQQRGHGGHLLQPHLQLVDGLAHFQVVPFLVAVALVGMERHFCLLQCYPAPISCEAGRGDVLELRAVEGAQHGSDASANALEGAVAVARLPWLRLARLDPRHGRRSGPYGVHGRHSVLQLGGKHCLGRISFILRFDRKGTRLRCRGL
mmetsp:Transcript_5998/g.11456  ORF Transcript_5998/g.11456 Transcript_5998/m.11456 type:complete len:233 (-) Transcript_5998:443-1141(-)